MGYTTSRVGIYIYIYTLFDPLTPSTAFHSLSCEDENFWSWSQIHFQLLLESAQRAAQLILNGPDSGLLRWCHRRCGALKGGVDTVLIRSGGQNLVHPKESKVPGSILSFFLSTALNVLVSSSFSSSFQRNGRMRR